LLVKLDGKKEKISCPVFLLQSNLLLIKRQPMCMADSVHSPNGRLLTLSSLKNTEICTPQFWATFYKVYIDDALILTKTGLGINLGDFFTNSSGHPCIKPINLRFGSTGNNRNNLCLWKSEWPKLEGESRKKPTISRVKQCKLIMVYISAD
jgi:hypothetical protein